MELYEFRMADNIGGYRSVYYTSGAEDIVTLGNLYVATPIQRGEISFEFDKNELSVTMPASVWPASAFKLVNPYNVVHIIVKDSTGVTMFDGRIQACTFKFDQGTARLVATSVQSILDTQVPVKVFSPACPFELYGKGCGLNSLAFRLTVPYSSTSVTTTTVSNALFAGQSDGYYEGGWIETVHERTAILKHVGDTLTIMHSLQITADDGDTFYVFPGCNKLLNTCSGKFNNEARFGGFPWVPLKNPVNEEF